MRAPLAAGLMAAKPIPTFDYCFKATLSHSAVNLRRLLAPRFLGLTQPHKRLAVGSLSLRPLHA